MTSILRRLYTITNYTIIIYSENIKHYFYLLAKSLDLLVERCPYCQNNGLVRWGYYTRSALPSSKPIRIQRIRCKRCGRTFSLLPSFLLARRSYSVSCLKTFVVSFISHDKDWKKSPELLVDLSTAYRWRRILRRQICARLPAIRKTLLHMAPETACLDAKTAMLLSDQVLFKRFLDISEQLYEAAVRLADTQTDSNTDIFNFLNFFLACYTAHPLLVL